MKRASAVVWVVWIILTILIAGGLVYWFQFKKIPELNKKIDDLQNQVNQLQEQSKDETADWETYENTKYGYSLKYPKDWFLYDKGFLNVETKKYELPQKTVFIDDKEIEDIPSGSDYPLAAVTINVEDEEFDFNEVKQDSSIAFSTVEVAGEEALKGISKKASDFDQSYGTYYYINHNSKGYIISWPNEDASGKHDSTYDKILETFQFSD
jgi:hypothetical protein